MLAGTVVVSRPKTPLSGMPQLYTRPSAVRARVKSSPAATMGAMVLAVASLFRFTVRVTTPSSLYWPLALMLFISRRITFTVPLTFSLAVTAPVSGSTEASRPLSSSISTLYRAGSKSK